MNVLQDSLLELIRRTSAEIPDDVHKAILDSLEREKQGTIAASAMKIIEQNIALAKNKSAHLPGHRRHHFMWIAHRLRPARLREPRASREAATRRLLRQNSWTRSPAERRHNVGPGSPRSTSTSTARGQRAARPQGRRL
jgi:fumarate hydratase class I